MKINLIVLVMLLLVASAERVSADPALKANPNPVVLPAGQTRGPTTLTWNTEGAEGYVWVSVDGGEETQLNEAGIAQGTFRTTAEVGKNYTFKLYTADKQQLLSSVTVTVVVEPGPPQPPANAQPGGARRGRGRKLVNNGQGFQLICRGGTGLRVSGTKIPLPRGNSAVPFPYLQDGWLIAFNHPALPPTTPGGNLQPGQCGPAPFALRDVDPAVIQTVISGNGSLVGSSLYPWEKSYQDANVDASKRLARFLDFLKDQKNYWSFFVTDGGEGFFTAGFSGYFELSPVQGVGRTKSDVPAGQPLAICAAARKARARNSPAAPGLEAQCRAAGAAGETPAFNLNDLAARGETVAGADPLATELRNQQPDDARRGFDIGMAAAEGHTAPGPGKQKIHDTLGRAEQRGFDAAVAFSIERNRNADLAANGALIAAQDPVVAEARTAESDVFYWLGFDIATGIFGDPALGANGNTATGPGSLKIRDSLSAAGQRGFNAAVKLHLSRNYRP